MANSQFEGLWVANGEWEGEVNESHGLWPAIKLPIGVINKYWIFNKFHSVFKQFGRNWQEISIINWAAINYL